MGVKKSSEPKSPGACPLRIPRPVAALAEAVPAAEARRCPRAFPLARRCSPPWYSNAARKNPGARHSQHRAAQQQDAVAGEGSPHPISHPPRTQPREAQARTRGIGAVIAHARAEKSDAQPPQNELTIFIIFLLNRFNSFVQNKMLPRRTHRPGPTAHRERRASLRRARPHALDAHPSAHAPRVCALYPRHHIGISPATHRLLRGVKPASHPPLLRHQLGTSSAH